MDWLCWVSVRRKKCNNLAGQTFSSVQYDNFAGQIFSSVRYDNFAGQIFSSVPNCL